MACFHGQLECQQTHSTDWNADPDGKTSPFKSITVQRRIQKDISPEAGRLVAFSMTTGQQEMLPGPSTRNAM